MSKYVLKGFCSKELTYVNEVFEMYVCPMFMKLIEWMIGNDTGFTVYFGKVGIQHQSR
ncbi:MAG: aminoglycoside 6-adenylyltransferase [Petrimonas sp.]